MFGFIKNTLTKAYESVTQKLSALFSTHEVDEDWLTTLRRVLLGADAGPAMTKAIIAHMREKMSRETVSGEEAHQILVDFLTNQLPKREEAQAPHVLLVVGVNGSGKTTFIGKLAHRFQTEGRSTLMVAGDTFRAAATEQLGVWAQRTGASLHQGNDNQDPASVVFDACKRMHDEKHDHLIIDTAGRLQTKTNLMHELSKIKRIVEKQLPEAVIHTWLVLDSMLGQNCVSQAKEFNEATHLSGLVLTKCDGTGKAGFILSISHELNLPVVYITHGEQLSALTPFDGPQFIKELLDKE
jgi:fused signal recognition particle receptor